MKFSKIVLISLLFMMFLFITSCDDNIEITDDKTEETTNNNEDKKEEQKPESKDDESIDDKKDSKDDGSTESNPSDGIDWPSEIVWP